jgi:transposase
VKPPTEIDLSPARLKTFTERLEQRCFTDEDYVFIAALMDMVQFLLRILDEKAASIKRLLRTLFGARTEKSRTVLGGKQGDKKSSILRKARAIRKGSNKPKGHGRNGVDAYPGADRVPVPHPSLHHGDRCPRCGNGKVYDTGKPGVPIRFRGCAPVQATVYELQTLRCNLCGEVFKPELPEQARGGKYDETVGTTIALLRYGGGFPHNRIERFQKSAGVPLPAATQWEIVKKGSECLKPLHNEMIRQAARGELLHNDDTTMRIVSLMPERNGGEPEADGGDEQEPSSQRKGVFTTGILSVFNGRRIALFFTGRKHGGENLRDVLKHRPPSLPKPIQMCDALSRNIPKEFKTVLANCTAHARRGFLDVIESFPEPCSFVIRLLARVYRNDDLARCRNLSPQERLEYHQKHSGPLMNKLKEWLEAQFEHKNVEPNSGLGKAIQYMLKRWGPLTLFLRKKNAPLDNNELERALKYAICHRKNSLFYLTQNGAEVGDRFMSVIHTANQAGVNAFDYLTALQRHHADVAKHPHRWMPWNYEKRVSALEKKKP